MIICRSYFLLQNLARVTAAPRSSFSIFFLLCLGGYRGGSRKEASTQGGKTTNIQQMNYIGNYEV